MARLPSRAMPARTARLEAKQKPIRYINWEGMEPRYASNFALSATAQETVLTVATIAPPVILRDEDWHGVKSVDALVVARLVLTDQHMEELIDLLARTYNERVGKEVYRKEAAGKSESEES